MASGAGSIRHPMTLPIPEDADAILGFEMARGS